MPFLETFEMHLQLTDNYIVWFIIGSLATYRVTIMLVEEYIFLPLRNLIGVLPGMEQHQQPNFVAKLLSCPFCTSFWVGTTFTLIMLFVSPFVSLPFAFSMVVILLERNL